MMTASVNMTSLESFYKIANGQNWNYASINLCLNLYANDVHIYNYPRLVGHAWNFTRDKDTNEYLVDPCDTAKAGVNFAGIMCECSTGGVWNAGCVITMVGLPCAGMRGSVTQLLTLLSSYTDLEFLDLSSNSLTDSIPDALGNLTKLNTLLLNDNNLSGRIPTQMRQLVQLQQLELQGNSLTGNIPEEINYLVKLRELNLNENQFSGKIPDLRSLTMLETLAMSDNLLTGASPGFTRQCESLTFLDLSFNKIVSSIPSELYNCRNLNALLLNDNHLTGSISPSISRYACLCETVRACLRLCI